MTRTRPSKKNLLRSALALLGVLALGLAASTATADEEASDADRTGSLYVEYLAGVSHHPDGTLRGANNSSVGLFGKARPAPVGYFVGAGLGGYVTDEIRLEVQVGYRLSEVDRIRVQGENSNAKNSEMSLLSVMYNAYYDFDLSDVETPLLTFDQSYVPLIDYADVDVSLDGGETWETVLHQTSEAQGRHGPDALVDFIAVIKSTAMGYSDQSYGKFL